MSRFQWICVTLLSVVVGLSLWGSGPGAAEPAAAPEADQPRLHQLRHRSPSDVLLDTKQQWLVTANQGTNTLSLIDLSQGKVVDEAACGIHPQTLVGCLDSHVLVSCEGSGELVLFAVKSSGEGWRLSKVRTIAVGFEPVGLTMHPDGKRAYAGLVATGEVAEIDLAAGKVARRFPVGKWPRYLAISPDGTRMGVGLSGESKIAVVDVEQGEVLYDEPLVGGINLGHMQCSADGKYVYFPWMVYRSNPITVQNIRLGWVLASRIGRVRLDGSSYREAISLDVPGKAIADPHGLALTPNAKRLVVSASGTHELLVYRLADLPFQGAGGPGDLIDRRLLSDRDLFYRIELGGRPMGLAMSGDHRTAYVANFLRDSVQVVDIEDRQVVREISLGPAPEPSLERRGMAIFYDGRRSLDQWYSCHTCHYNGGINSRAMDTLNDGTQLTMKTVLPLYQVHQTKPWTWHGWQTDLDDAMQKSFTTTMKGRPIDPEDRQAVLAYLASLEPPASPFRNADGSLTAAARRGKQVFESAAAGCATCHSGPQFTDGQIHDVGLGSETDRYQGFNTPTLRGVYRKVRLLHDGRSKSLEEVLTDDHAPEKVAGTRKLSEAELQDLIAYLKSL